MGSEDLFHKRKARRTRDSERKKASRKPYDRVLIVCEGEKTEPFYFEEVRQVLELDSANIEIDGSCGSSPISVVDHALALFDKDRTSGDIYNSVYCVFDRDSHPGYEEAILKAQNINASFKKNDITKKIKFLTIRSIPSFEYWLLLHFIATAKPYEKTEHKSTGEQVIDDLKAYIPNYKKTQKGLFKKSMDDGTLQHALAQSERIFISAKKTGHLNPSTNMHELVNCLLNLKQKTVIN